MTTAMPDVDTMASWAVIGVAVFVAWVLVAMLIGMWLGRVSKHYPPPDDVGRYERRWRDDDGDDP